jgi:hypothetical protein
MRVWLRIGIAALVAAGVTAAARPWVAAQGRATVAIDPDDIGGVVTSAKGPEAGVWVVAETTETPTRFIRIVVTDDQGRYVLPDLPRANFDVFVRGYGLVDSPRVKAKPGQPLDLKAVVAPDAKAAAEYYPAAWWMAMLKLPEGAQEQEKFQQTMRGCLDCHQLGNKATRELSPAAKEGAKTTLEAWDKRTKFGPSGAGMGADFQGLGEARKTFADWTDRIMKGELPKTAPPRPKGVERNLVLTLWDWGSAQDGRSDNVSTDKRDPHRNANGPIYGVSQPTDALMILDPVENKASVVKIPSTSTPIAPATASPTWGGPVWNHQADPRSAEMDAKGRVWLTARHHPDRPAWCTDLEKNKYAKNYKLLAGRGGGAGAKQVANYDPKTQKFDVVDVCFPVDHNELSEDNFIYYGTNNSIGWINMDAWDKTHDPSQSQGWCPAVIDSNGDGKVGPGWTEPDQPLDPAKDRRVEFGCYAIAYSEKDHGVWCSSNVGTQFKLTLIQKGANPPETCRAEMYTPPAGQRPPMMGTGGVTVDRNGIVWQSWRVSGHFVAFDRKKCKSPDRKADGQHCPEGWTIYRDNEPEYTNSPYHASEPYLNHIDSVDALGLGIDSPMYASINTDSMEVFSAKTKQFVPLRVPYPMGYFARSATARLDDPNTGWKGKGLWSSFATYAPWHQEGGKGSLPKVVKFQMRPNPLAK